MLTEELLDIAPGRMFNKMDSALQNNLLLYITWQIFTTLKTTVYDMCSLL